MITKKVVESQIDEQKEINDSNINIHVMLLQYPYGNVMVHALVHRQEPRERFIKTHKEKIYIYLKSNVFVCFAKPRDLTSLNLNHKSYNKYQFCYTHV